MNVSIVSYCAREAEKDFVASLKNTGFVVLKDPPISKSLIEVSREKRDSLFTRMEKSFEIADSIKGNVILWHHLEAERMILEKHFKGTSFTEPSSYNKELKIDDYAKDKQLWIGNASQSLESVRKSQEEPKTNMRQYSKMLISNKN